MQHYCQNMLKWRQKQVFRKVKYEAKIRWNGNKDRRNKFSHMRLRTPTVSLVPDRSIRDDDLARGIHAFLCESKQRDATFIVGIVPLRL